MEIEIDELFYNFNRRNIAQTALLGARSNCGVTGMRNYTLKLNRIVEGL